MNGPFSILILGANLVMPVADKVPEFNVVPSCRGAAQIAMADSQSYDNCVKEENGARQQLLSSWESFPAADRATCSASSSTEGLASYVELLVCLQIASNVEQGQRTILKGARRK